MFIVTEEQLNTERERVKQNRSRKSQPPSKRRKTERINDSATTPSVSLAPSSTPISEHGCHKVNGVPVPVRNRTKLAHKRAIARVKKHIV